MIVGKSQNDDELTMTILMKTIVSSNGEGIEGDKAMGKLKIRESRAKAN